MRQVTVQLFVPWLGFLAVCLYAASISQDFVPSSIGGFWNANAQAYMTYAGLGDAGSYIKYARFLEDGLKGDGGQVWISKTWAPGFPAMIAMVFLLTGEDHYFVKMTVVNVLAWSICLTYVFRLLTPAKHHLLVFLALSGVLFLPEFRPWLFGQGAVMSESLTLCFLVAGFGALGNALMTSDRRTYLLATVLMGLAATVKGSLDIMFVFCLLTFLLGTGALVISARLLQRWLDGLGGRWARLATLRPAAVRGFKLGLVCLLLYAAMTSPWKTLNYSRTGDYTFSYYGPILEFMGQWSRSAQDYEAAGIIGINTACLVDPVLCATIDKDHTDPAVLKRLTIKTMLSHPVKWVQAKLPQINYFWVGLPWTTWNQPGEWLVWLRASVYLAFLFVTPVLVLLGVRRNRPTARLALLLLAGGFFMANVITFTIGHYELRYSLPLKVLGLWLFAMCLVLRFAKDPSLDAKAPSTDAQDRPATAT